MTTAFCVTYGLRLKPYVTHISLNYTLTRTNYFKAFPSKEHLAPKNLGMILDQPYLATKLSAHWMLRTGATLTLFNFQQIIAIFRERIS